MISPEQAKNYFTGSYPPALNGWHLNILFKARKRPFKAPYVLTASIEYSEQVGVNLQLEGSRGEKIY